PPPRPPQSTIPQLTSLLINNAGALGPHRGPGLIPFGPVPYHLPFRCDDQVISRGDTGSIDCVAKPLGV
ncbi:hypothetical protein OSH45_23010, partial [Mycobacterium ulcerans]|nr:hypothetical protein [Mycobacterium ulcerans]MEB4054187.1 hypothetical protein [Mycobacterium ulcerans]MEB4207270.1 hypothetical protein [Mycobacterium ulcerans]